MRVDLYRHVGQLVNGVAVTKTEKIGTAELTISLGDLAHAINMRDLTFKPAQEVPAPTKKAATVGAR